MQVETCKYSFKHLLVSYLQKSHWIKQVTLLDAESERSLEVRAKGRAPRRGKDWGPLMGSLYHTYSLLLLLLLLSPPLPPSSSFLGEGTELM